VSTVDGLNAAWDSYMTALAGSDVSALVRARDQLEDAARAHDSQARSLASIIRYYAAVNADPEADPADVLEIATELDAARRAAAVLAGAWPGTAPAVSAGG
jgi:hypothetical protein